MKPKFRQYANKLQKKIEIIHQANTSKMKEIKEFIMIHKSFYEANLHVELAIYSLPHF